MVTWIIGVKYFNELVKELKQSDNKIISGEKAFFMYDTLGFPIDLTQIMATENNINVDIEGFKEAMNNQKERSRIATKSKRLAGRNVLTFGAEQTSYLQSMNILPTIDESKYTWDVNIETEINAIYTSNNGFIHSISDISNINIHDTIGIVLTSSPFYAEAGGQVPDTGKLIVKLSNNQELVLDVLDVQVSFLILYDNII